ncbi:hypothetical protein PIB30_050849 [Stylosanthes scabra]|uniref:Uncharacterized protein n=1 Tax=Stylosanthes scabra TaxID=79078 RepID=A0ABU6ZGJ3_9FABA|nr:hypothetical protein [Stylosanthes scabra]
MDPLDDRIRDLLRLAGFGHVAFMLQWDHDWALVSVLHERDEYLIARRGLPVRLRIDRDPVSGCISGRELHYDGTSIEAMCLDLLGVIPTERNRQRDNWNVHSTWLHETVCGVLEDNSTPERLLQYMRGYIMQIIGVFLFRDASDSRVHLKWLPLLI